MRYKYIGILIVLSLMIGCGGDSNRRIKLASKPSSGLMKDRVETITIAASQKKKIAIFDFSNQTGNADLDWMESGIVEMLSSDLSQARQLHLIPDMVIHEQLDKYSRDNLALADSNIALQIAIILDAEAYICGAYDIENDSLSIKLELRDGISGTLLHKTSIFGGGLENVFSMVDRATRQLRSELQLTFRDKSEIDERFADFTTTSLEAYKFYTQGLDEIERFNFKAAKPHFLRAAKEDTAFASAYYQMAYIGIVQNRFDSARIYINKAVQFIDNTPLKEKMFIESMAALLYGEISKAGEIYNTLVETFPDDDHVHYFIGNYYYGTARDVNRAVEHFEAAVTLNPNNKLALNMLGYAYERIEKLDYAIDAFSKYANIADNEANPYDSMGEIYLRNGRLDEAIENFKKALKRDEKYLASRTNLVRAYLDKSDYKKALNETKVIHKLAETTAEKYRAYMAQTGLFIRAGKLETATEYCQKAYDLDPYQPPAIIVLYYLENDQDKANARMDKWISHEKSIVGEKEITFDKLFTIASFSLYMGVQVDRIDELLTEFIEQKRDQILFQAAVAYKQIIDYQNGTFDSTLLSLFEDNFNPVIYSQMPPVAWDIFWKFYFPSLKKAIQSGALPKDYLQGYKEFAVENDNQHFEIQGSFAVAYENLLRGQISIAKKQLQFLGSSLESNWQVIGPFKITKGLHQEFWPERKKMDQLLQMQDEKEWIDRTDKITDGYIDFKKLTESEINSAAYAILPLNVPSPRTVQFRFGINGPMKVWLNDELILVKNTSGVAILDAYKVPVHLQEGTNYIKIKMNNVLGESGFYFRVTDDEGYGFYDITFGESLAT
jgi:tetratricopeptide (TPR) repeat protein